MILFILQLLLLGINSCKTKSCIEIFITTLEQLLFGGFVVFYS